MNSRKSDGPSSSTTEAARTALAAPDDHQTLRVACYCEENVWRLAYRKIHQKDHNEHQYYAVFISNPRKLVPMYHQVADPSRACCWDYHCILLRVDDDDGAVVFDMDSCLPYGCSIDDYLRHTFAQELLLDSNHAYAPRFRLVEASVYLSNFSSDRMHMYNKQTGQWSAPPPGYPCIQPIAGAPSNLSIYWDMENDRIGDDEVAQWSQKAREAAFGVVLTGSQLRQALLVL